MAFKMKGFSGFKSKNDFEKIAKSRAKQNKLIQKDLESRGYTFSDSKKSASRGNIVENKAKTRARNKILSKVTNKIGAKNLSKAIRAGGKLTGMVGLGAEAIIAAQKAKSKAYKEMDKRSPGTSKRLETGAYGNQGGVRGTFFGAMKMRGPGKKIDEKTAKQKYQEALKAGKIKATTKDVFNNFMYKLTGNIKYKIKK